jgi:hypothetical protein
MVLTVNRDCYHKPISMRITVLGYVVWYKLTDVSQESTASIFKHEEKALQATAALLADSNLLMETGQRYSYPCNRPWRPIRL